MRYTKVITKPFRNTLVTYVVLCVKKRIRPVSNFAVNNFNLELELSTLLYV